LAIFTVFVTLQYRITILQKLIFELSIHNNTMLQMTKKLQFNVWSTLQCKNVFRSVVGEQLPSYQVHFPHGLVKLSISFFLWKA